MAQYRAYKTVMETMPWTESWAWVDSGLRAASINAVRYMPLSDRVSTACQVRLGCLI
jgi:hypothetical protein